MFKLVQQALDYQDDDYGNRKSIYVKIDTNIAV